MPNGDLYIQISIGKETAQTLMPSIEKVDEAEAFINRAVLSMAKDIYRKRRNRTKRERKLE